MDPGFARLGWLRTIVIATMIAIPASVAIPGVALAEGEVPPDVAYAANPQNGSGNSFSAPYQWWMVALTEGDVLEASLTVTSETNDEVYLWLYLPGTTHHTQNSRVASGPFEYTATQTGDYLFCAYSFWYSTTSYRIDWTLTPGLSPTTVTLKLSGLTNGGLPLGSSVTAKGKVTSESPDVSSVKITVQRRVSGAWSLVKKVTRTLSATDTYTWVYRPAARGSYRARTTVAATETSLAGASTWKAFTVR